MIDVLKDPAFLAAAAAFAGAVLPIVLKALFDRLKAKAAKTENTVDDELVRVIESAVVKALKK